MTFLGPHGLVKRKLLSIWVWYIQRFLCSIFDVLHLNVPTTCIKPESPVPKRVSPYQVRCASELWTPKKKKLVLGPHSHNWIITSEKIGQRSKNPHPGWSSIPHCISPWLQTSNRRDTGSIFSIEHFISIGKKYLTRAAGTSKSL